MAQLKVPFKDISMVKGIPFPSFITEQRMDELKNFSLRADDVFVAGYCKSGTTWLQLIVKLILNNGKEDGKTVVETIPWLAAVGTQHLGRWPAVDIDAMPSPRAFKSHEPYDMVPGGLPSSSPAKYIYIARNPKDAIVSSCYHFRWDKQLGFLGNESDVIKGYAYGTMHFGSWFNHVLGWWKHKDHPNILFIKYEDMKKDAFSIVSAIAEFIGCGLEKKVIDSIVGMTTFDAMKDRSSSWLPKHFHHEHPNEEPFMRKGVVGDWKNHFTAEQWAEFDAVYAEKMNDTGLKFDFEI